MENKKQELVGKVVSTACDKTITIAVVTYKKHPLYKKNVKTTKKYEKKSGTHSVPLFLFEFTAPCSGTPAGGGAGDYGTPGKGDPAPEYCHRR